MSSTGLHCKGKTEIVNSLDGVKDFLSAFTKAQRSKINITEIENKLADESWQKPPEGSWKMNVDACVNSGKNLYGVGGVIRNSQGEILLAFGKRTGKPGSVLEAELKALKEGLQIAVDRNIAPLLVMSDSNLAVQAVTQPLDNLSYVGLWATDILHLQNSLSGTTINHSRCSANIVAHSIASFASSFSSPFIWESGNFPIWLQDIVTQDCSY